MPNGKILSSSDKEFGLCPEDCGESVSNFKLGMDMIASVLKPHPGCSVENGLDAPGSKLMLSYSIFITTRNEKGKNVCSLVSSAHAYRLVLDSRLQSLSLVAWDSDPQYLQEGFPDSTWFYPSNR